MEIRPIISALLRNKVGAILIALQVAITLAVISNAVFIISERQSYISRPTGLDLDNTFAMSIVTIESSEDIPDMMTRELDILRGTDGVTAATVMRAFPMSGSTWCNTYKTSPDAESGDDICQFWIDQAGDKILDLKFIEGGFFKPSDIRYRRSRAPTEVSRALISKSIAEQFFPGEKALGKLLYDSDPDAPPVEVVGVYETLIGGHVHGEDTYDNMLLPEVVYDQMQHYVVRTAPGKQAQVMTDLEQKLGQLPNRMITRIRSMEEYKERNYSSDLAMIKILSTVIALLAAITALGVLGLAWFNVNKRRKQIGTRRALGATRIDIIRYFMVENWLITSAGLVFGVFLALLLNYQLDSIFQVGKMNFAYILTGMVALWIIGQLAVIVPAKRASSISPAIATRTA